MKTSRSFLALAAVLTCTSAVFADSGPQVTPQPEAAKPQISKMQQVAARLTKLQELAPTNNLHLASGSMGFVKVTKSAVFVGLHNMLVNSFRVTKYERTKEEQSKKRKLNQNPVAVENGLFAVKSETYNADFDGRTCSIRKAVNGRSATPFGEKIARVIGAATNPANLDTVGVVDLYANCIPMWIQADDAAGIDLVRNWLLDEMVNLSIDSASIDEAARPVVVLSLKNDLLLNGIGEDLESGMWATLRSLFTMTTFMNNSIRDLIFAAKDNLVEIRREAKSNGVKIDGSFAEGLFDDIAAASDYFDLKKMTRSVIKGIYEKFEKFGIPALLIFGSYKIGKWAFHKVMKTDEKNAARAQQALVRQREQAVDDNLQALRVQSLMGVDVTLTPSLARQQLMAQDAISATANELAKTHNGDVAAARRTLFAAVERHYQQQEPPVDNREDQWQQIGTTIDAIKAAIPGLRTGDYANEAIEATLARVAVSA